MPRARKISRVSLVTAAAVVSLLGGVCTFTPSTRALVSTASVKLYALDGGTIDFADLGMMADTGEFDGKPGRFVAPAFLIRHPSGNLLWDTGLGDGLAKQPKGVTTPHGITMTVTKPLMEQLKELTVTPQDINYVGFSHLHADHTGNANLFSNATWIVSQRELAWAHSKPTPIGVDPSTLTGAKKLHQSDGDIDLFGDGKVRILRTPGHTPDHRVLMVKCEHDGTVILSGDLYHTRQSVKKGLVPTVNVSRADTLASFDRVGKLLKQYNARLIVQHAPEDFAGLPKPPQYLD